MLQKKLLMFKQTVGEFFSSKTNWTGLTMIVVGGLGAYSGNMEVGTAVQSIMGGLSLLFIRDAIAGR